LGAVVPHCFKGMDSLLVTVSWVTTEMCINYWWFKKRREGYL